METKIEKSVCNIREAALTLEEVMKAAKIDLESPEMEAVKKAMSRMHARIDIAHERTISVIEMSKGTEKELNYIVEMHKRYGAPYTVDSVQTIGKYVLASIADGSRRPGSWERQMLESLGLVADAEEHQMYRKTYGASQ